MAISRRPARATPLAKSGDIDTKRIEYAAGTSNKYLQFFQSYGVTLSSQREQLQGDCPFIGCRKEGHFYASSASGQWDCKKCGKSGNIYTFMSFLHKSYLSIMSPADYEWIAKQRPGISVPALKHYAICRFGPSSVLLPTYNSEGSSLVSLPIWRELSDTKTSTTSYRILNPPIVPTSVFGLQHVRPSVPLYICEGQWDLLALYSAFSTIRISGKPFLTTASIISTPGASAFPQRSLSLLDNRDIFILYDNDSAGMTGADSLLNAISRNGVTPRKISSLKWPTHYPTGFDIRDLASKGVQ